jgi:hypothetical protein
MIDNRGAQGDERGIGVAGPPARHFGGGPPPHRVLRRHRHLRFERGGLVYATDGRIGVLKQVVVDEVAGEVVELIVKLDHGDQALSLPPELVDKTAGSAVFLVTNRDATLTRRLPDPAQPTRLVRVDPKALSGKERRLRDRQPRPRRAIAQAGKDYVETPPLPAPGRVEPRVGVLASGAD